MSMLLGTCGVFTNADQDVSRMSSLALLSFAKVVDSPISCAKCMLSEPGFFKCFPEPHDLSCLINTQILTCASNLS